MARIKLMAPIANAVGKIFGGSDMWLVERYGTQFTGCRTNPRDYKKHPQSEAEKAGTLRLTAATKAYNELIKGSVEWQALEQEYLAQRDYPDGKKSLRGYFISKHMRSGF
ncbi:MAG: hypothetical protein IIU55_06645 [Paludibacteraceae bacterium]|jgi:hypothetical protein|nr:hypothetical protein [Paludibacteraceae bacterium]